MIDPRAIVDSKAKIGANVSIGPFSIIGPDVEIGDGTWIGSHTVIEGYTKIGRNNKIFQFAAVGAIPQDKKFHGEKVFLEIGDNNSLREFCTIHPGTEQGGGITKIGNDNLIMNYVHIAHDCIIADDNIFANNTSFAGHVIVGNHVVFGGFAKVGQFCRVSDYSFVAASADVSKDVLPYVIVTGCTDSIKTCGLNLIGLKRRGFKEETLRIIKEAYNIILREGLTVQQALPKLAELVVKCSEIQLFIDALNKSEKGVLR